MKNIREITKINTECNSQGISIFEYLTNNNITWEDFCISIGLDITLLNDIAGQVLDALLKDKETRLYFTPNKNSLDHEEISIYSPNLKINFGFRKDIIKINWDKNTKESNYQRVTNEFMGVQRENNTLTTLHFSGDMVIDLNQATKHILTTKYPLEQIELKIKYTKEQSDGTILVDEAFQVTIDHDMLYSTLENIYQLLYNFNYPLAVGVLKLYPSTSKIISDKTEMNNFLNR